jgi:hypothetical protein
MDHVSLYVFVVTKFRCPNLINQLFQQTLEHFYLELRMLMSQTAMLAHYLVRPDKVPPSSEAGVVETNGKAYFWNLIFQI